MIRVVTVGALLLLLAAPRAAGQYSFTDLSIYDDALGYIDPVGLSPDGNTILGSYVYRGFDFASPIFIQNGMRTELPAGSFRYGIARSMAPNGTIVGGFGQSVESFTNDAPVWINGTYTLLEYVFDDGSADANAISSDGRVIVGTAAAPSYKRQPARWVDGEVEPLGDLSGSDSTGTALAVSADGSVIVGSAAGNTRAFRWMNGDMEALPLIDEEDIETSSAFDVSGDGRRIVGQQTHFNFLTDGLLWEDGVVHNIGYLPGGNKTFPYAISADGEVIGGASGPGFGAFEAFVWDDTNGMQNLRQVLSDGGADLLGWTQLTRITDISADGRTLLGSGFNAEGDFAYFLATIPEPSTLALTGVGLALLARRRR